MEQRINQHSLTRSQIDEQLGLKADCLMCKLFENKNGSRKGYRCYHCGRCYNDYGGYEPALTKKFIYREFQEAGVILSDHDVELVFSKCANAQHLAFGATLGIILQSAIESKAKKHR